MNHLIVETDGVVFLFEILAHFIHHPGCELGRYTIVGLRMLEC